MDKDLIEQLAAHCHDNQWSGWMEYLFSKCEPSYDNDGYDALTIPNWAYQRWGEQMATRYKDLPEDQKESDRAEARAILGLLEE